MSDNPWAPGGSEPAGDEPVGDATQEIVLEHTTEVATGGGRLMRMVAGGVGGALLLGGVGFAATQLSGDDSTPQSAVEDLFEAIENEDILGVLASLDAGERDAVRAPMEDAIDELKRLEVVDGSLDLGDVGGIDITFDGLTYRTEDVRDGLARVHLTGGVATTSYDRDVLPVGDFVTDAFERFDIDFSGQSGPERGDPITETDPTTFLAARRGSDGWRVSIGYTAAEAARSEMLLAPPTPAQSLDAIGADSPEAAVEGAVRALASLDVPGFVARLSPNEMAALHEYWGLFTADTEFPSAAGFDTSVTIDRLDLRSERDGRRARVFVEGFAVSGTADDTTVGIDVADGCITLLGDLDELEVPDEFRGTLCGDEINQAFESSLDLGEGFDSAGLDDAQQMFPFNPFGLFDFSDVDAPDFEPLRPVSIGVMTHEVSGDWYVAPIGTTFDLGVQALRSLERSHLDALLDLGEQVGQAFSSPSFDPSEDQFDLFEDQFDSFSGDQDPFAPLDLDEVERLEAFIDQITSGLPEIRACMLRLLWTEGRPDLLRDMSRPTTFWQPETHALFDRVAQNCEPS